MKKMSTKNILLWVAIAIIVALFITGIVLLIVNGCRKCDCYNHLKDDTCTKGCTDFVKCFNNQYCITSREGATRILDYLQGNNCSDSQQVVQAVIGKFPQDVVEKSKCSDDYWFLRYTKQAYWETTMHLRFSGAFVAPRKSVWEGMKKFVTKTLNNKWTADSDSASQRFAENVYANTLTTIAYTLDDMPWDWDTSLNKDDSGFKQYFSNLLPKLSGRPKYQHWINWMDENYALDSYFTMLWCEDSSMNVIQFNYHSWPRKCNYYI